MSHFDFASKPLARAARWAMGAVAFAACGVSLAQGVGQPLLSPSAVHQGISTTIAVQTQVYAANVIPGSVNVQMVGASGRVTVLGLLNDNGADGDVVAGDRVYSGSVILNEAVEGTVGIRVSFATRGSLRRTLSAISPIAVLPPDAPLEPAAGDLDKVTVDPASGARIVGDLVHVCFQGSVSYATVKALATLVQATPVGSSPDIGNCFQLQLPTVDAAAVSTAIATLAAQPEVVYAEPDYERQALADSCSVLFICTDVNYLQVLRLAVAHGFKNSDGAGTRIAVIDSGLNPLYFGSPGFPGLILGTDFVRAGGPPVQDDLFGHGTRVALIAQATAPQSSLLITRILNDLGKTNDGRYEKALDEAKAKGARIINMSFGDIYQSRRILDKLTQLQNAGILLVAAAGNSGDTVRVYPAAHVGTIAVGNVDQTDLRWTGSPFPASYGFWVNIAAPGVKIANSADAIGSSFSAPWVAGTLALIKSKFPAMTAAELKDQLYRTAMPIPAVPNADQCPNLSGQPITCNQGLGVGRVDPVAALGAIRLTRVTAVGASAAGTPRTVEVAVSNAAGVVLYSASHDFLGQSFGCQLKTPPCILDVPFDFADLAPGTYSLRVSFRTAGATVIGEARLMAPNATFSGVSFGAGGAIDPADNRKATYNLFGGSAPTVIFAISKS